MFDQIQTVNLLQRRSQNLILTLDSAVSTSDVIPTEIRKILKVVFE